MKRSNARKCRRKGPKPPAPIRRAGARELEKTVNLVRKSPLLKSVLDWVDGFVMVLNPQRQIVALSDNLPEPLDEGGADAYIGKRPGELLGCAFADQGPGGCGTSPACRFCGGLDSILKSRKEPDSVDSEVKFTTVKEGGEVSQKYRVRASRFPLSGRDFTLLFLQRADRENQDAPPTAAPGKKTLDEIQGYSIVRKLGSGAMGAVYLVRNEKGRLFALKTLLSDFTGDPEVLRRFRRELRIALRLEHKNIVKTYSSAKGKAGNLFMICEFCRFGSAWRALQAQGPLPLDLALFWMIGTARGLDHVWCEHRVVHRDIKPDNLLVGENRHVKISDFGIARRFDLPSRLTLVGHALGTPQYMSPEQGEGRTDLDVRTDLYSLGATFYHLLSGKPPHDGATPMSVLIKLRTRKPVPLRKLRAGVPRALAECVDGLLSHDLRDRPPGPSALLEDLYSLAKRMGVNPDRAPASARAVQPLKVPSTGFASRKTRSLGI